MAEEVKKKFPDNFKNPNRRKASSVEGGTGEHRGGGKKGWSDLPRDAQEACTRFIEQKLYIGDDGNPMNEKDGRAKYINDYFTQENEQWLRKMKQLKKSHR